MTDNPSTTPNVRRLKSDDFDKIGVSYAEHEALMIDLSASEKEVRRLRRVVANLEREQAVTEDSPDAKDVQALLDLWWAEVKGSKADVLHGLESTRAPKVRAALKRRRRNQGDDEGFDMCRRAVLGVRYDDWAMGRVRKSGERSFNDIAEHILNTDGDIEKFAALYDKNVLEQQSPPVKEGPVARRLERIERGDAAPIDTILQRLQDRGLDWRATPSPDTWRAQCPAHGGDGFSLAITRNASGMILTHCHSHGCLHEDVMSALDLDVSASWRNSETDHQARDYVGPRRLSWLEAQRRIDEIVDLAMTREPRQAA